MITKGLTIRQQAILDFIKEFIAAAGYPPSLRDIARHFGINSPKNVAKHLDAIERKGFIKRSAVLSRGIDVLDGMGRGVVSVPIAGHVRAGVPHLAVEDVVGHVALDVGFFKCAGAFILKVVGDSMIEAGIDDGDYVLVRPQKDAENGDIVVAVIGGEATVKRLFVGGGSITLNPANPAYRPVIVMDDGQDFSIAGKVVSVIKQIER
ncbi:MAG: repressor LexA [Deltaproteobacteria bacterium RIFCSPLOWO2_02_FULL_53_8]|nr:MAG: repressor LexA [Deltaproteobacteria bacterium RIFCSPLOWO2_02_FULL_53_8]